VPGTSRQGGAGVDAALPPDKPIQRPGIRLVRLSRGVEPYESTEYQGIVDFHWGATSFIEAKRLAGAAQHPELVLLRIMSQIDGVDSISIKDERRTMH
jgi:hypothetical protein